MAQPRSLEESAQILDAFDRVVSREAYNLSRWPELTWQQLHNRLQWKEPVRPLLEPERRRRSVSGSPLWMRTRTPFRESRALLRTLQGHTVFVNACAVAPDGSFVVSASGDNTLKVWDPSTGEELRTLQGHTDVVHGCAVAADGSFMVSAGEDNTLKVWDPSTGEELRAVQVHTGPVFGCAAAPDGSFVVSSAGGDSTLKLWDPSTGEGRGGLRGHTGAVCGCAVAPDGSLVARARC